jgi:hypothetical protein
MPPFDSKMTTELFWSAAAVVAVVDVGLILLARWLVTPERFRQMKWPLTLASGVFFFTVWATVLGWGWDWFYRYIFPPWGRYLPPVFGVGYAVCGLGMWWLAQKIRGHPAVFWCLLGGLEGLLSHIWAIWGLGAASKPPIIQGANPWVVLFFAVFEKMCYWSVILLVTAALSVSWRRSRNESRSP